MTTSSPNTARERIDGELGAELAPIIEWLAAPRADIERVFLEMGDSLVGCAQLLNDISAAHEGMPAELSGEAFSRASRRLEAIRDQVMAMGTSHSGEQQNIARLFAMAASVASPLHDLRRTAATIEIITTNARIVAADLGGQEGEFAVFTTDMGELGRRVERVVGEFSQAYERLIESLGVAERANAAFTARHGDTLVRIAARIDEHLRSVTGHRERGALKAAEHSRLTGQIGARVGMAVSALQTGDITRQRVEHIEQALDVLAEHVATASGEDDEPLACEDTIAAVCRLQAVQLDETTQDFDQRVAELAETLRKLAEDAAVALRDNDQESEALLANSGTALAAMTSDLRGIGSLFEDFEQTRAGLEKVAGESAHAMTEMVERLDAIRDIEQRIRLLSLNTAIRCSQLGERGRALRVVAGFLGDLARQTVAASDAILAGLEEADELARHLVRESSADASGKMAGLEEEVDAVQLELDGVVERLSERAETVASAGPRAVRLLEEAAANVLGRQGFSDDWRRALTELESFAHPGDELYELTDVDADLIARLRAHYTMDSERRVHDRLFGSPSASEPELEETKPETEPVTDLDDIFF
ncbi:chemotaxis protein [Litchfieldella qijiaojingensis]|uniref:Chemotaxis protein n=1 Tax=Litchfieldella qijiaojingensis TaxID=980347 RepID=A0ABQ2ZDA4_9GAMM|nr:methyl-accepting chemotaxis protein [Halomonas qijiaojingensis]GGY08869.1 chemotaxis protein [Halomonas qijiaojingensis]